MGCLRKAETQDQRIKLMLLQLQIEHLESHLLYGPDGGSGVQLDVASPNRLPEGQSQTDKRRSCMHKNGETAKVLKKSTSRKDRLEMSPESLRPPVSADIAVIPNIGLEAKLD